MSDASTAAKAAVLPLGAIPGGGQYFYALVIVGGFAIVGWVAALLLPRSASQRRAT